jgi:hypothetical protein
MFKTTRIAGYSTYLIAFLAFALSYSKLTDLAARAGYTEQMAHLWPIIVDGLAVVATLGVLRLRERRWYAWTLLTAATSVSVAAAVASAMFPNNDLPPLAAALVSVVPPLCLLVAPHLAVQLMREAREDEAPHVETIVDVASKSHVATQQQVSAPVAVEPKADVAPKRPTVTAPETGNVEAPTKPATESSTPGESTNVADLRATQRENALKMVVETNLSLREIAKRVGTSDMSVGRWAKDAGIDTRARSRNITRKRNEAQGQIQVG